MQKIMAENTVQCDGQGCERREICSRSYGALALPDSVRFIAENICTALNGDYFLPRPVPSATENAAGVAL